LDGENRLQIIKARNLFDNDHFDYDYGDEKSYGSRL
jgi:hypothetical protein